MKQSLLKPGMLVEITGDNTNRPGGNIRPKESIIGKRLKLRRFVSQSKNSINNAVHEDEEVLGYWEMMPSIENGYSLVFHPSQFRVIRDEKGRFVKDGAPIPKKKEEKDTRSKLEKQVDFFLGKLEGPRTWIWRGAPMGPCYAVKMASNPDRLIKTDLDAEAWLLAYIKWRKGTKSHGMAHLCFHTLETNWKQLLAACEKMKLPIFKTNSIHTGQYDCYWVVLNFPKDEMEK